MAEQRGGRPKVMEVRKTVSIDGETDNALEYLKKTVPGGYVLSSRIRQVIKEDAKKFGWVRPDEWPVETEE